MLSADQKAILRQKLKEWVPSGTFSGDYGRQDGHFLHADPKKLLEKHSVSNFLVLIGRFLEGYDFFEIPNNPRERKSIKRTLSELLTDPPPRPSREWPLCKGHFNSLRSGLYYITHAGEERIIPPATTVYSGGETIAYPEGGKEIIGNPTEREWQRLEAAPFLLAEAKRLIQKKQAELKGGKVGELDIILSEISAFETELVKMFQEVGIDIQKNPEGQNRGR